MSYQVTSAILGVLLALIILSLIRRDILHSRHALWWIGVAFMVFLLGLFPRIIDVMAFYLGVNYPPTLLFILGMAMILIKVISIDIHQSQLERKIRRLTQRLAIFEAEQMSNQDRDH